MSEKPILFSGSMVRAILEGRKTQTRRVLKMDVPDHVELQTSTDGRHITDDFNGPLQQIYCPYGVIGDRLWVRENIYFHRVNQNHYYSADKHGVGNEIHSRLMAETSSGTCKATARTIPSIFMHKFACRLFLEITDIRVERLRDISEEDAVAEGIDAPRCTSCGYSYADICIHMDHHLCGEPSPDTARKVFQTLWDSINGKRAPWSDNPWVWVVEFEHKKGQPS